MSFAAELDKAIGANSKSQDVSMWLDTGVPELNDILSGSISKGLPVGRLIEIFGPASCGKTFLATMVMKAAQEAGGIAGFSDHERSFKADFAAQLGLDVENPEKWRYIRPQTFEESVSTAINFCELVRSNGWIPPEAPLVWVFDSVASMIPHEKLFDKEGKRRDAKSYTMRDKLLLAGACSQNYPVLAQFAEDNNMLVLLLNQIRMKPGVMFGDPTTTPGGQAAEFYASIRLSISRTVNKDKTTKEATGFKVTCKTIKNKVARFDKKAEWEVVYRDDGGCFIDRVATSVDYLVKIGGITKASTGRLEYEGKTYPRASLIALLNKDVDASMETLTALIEEVKAAA
jgi:protein RecA